MTEKQEKFLAVLFEEAEGDIRTAMHLAGYSATTPVSDVTKALAKEIHQLTKKYIEDSTVLASVKLRKVLEAPHHPGARETITAAEKILDRGGFDKAQKVEVTTPKAVFMLPDKDES